MRRFALIVILLLVLVAGMSAAQDEYTPALLKKLGLDEAQVNGIAEILDRGRGEIQRAQAEINVQKALLSRMLLNPNPDMREVERSLRAAMEQEVTIRLLQIQRELAVRTLIGDRRWAQLRDLARQQAARQAQAAASAAGGAAAGGAAGAPTGAQAQRLPSATQGGKEPSKEERVRSLLKELLQLLGEDG